MQIVDNRLVLLRTRNPGKYSIIPKSKVLDDEHVAVHWGLDETRVLRNLGVKGIPSPITGRYDWPGRYKPMAHQMETAGFLTLHRRAFCFDETGVGKTMSALWAADYLMSRGEIRRALVLCPMSIMQSAWMADLMSSIMHRTAIVAHHTKASRRIEMVQGDYDFVIMNYDGLPLVSKEIVADGRFDLVIIDECNAAKNTQTRRWKAIASILKPTTYLWMMTGTPAAQSPVDAFGLAKLVNPGGVPNYQTAWRDKVMNKVSMFRWVPKHNAKDIVHAALQPAIRHTKAECLDLPPVMTVTREVEMTPQQNKYYNLLKDQFLIQAAGQTISAVNAGVAVNKLLQISCIKYNTRVCTQRGWVPIQDVQTTDLVWDGVEFVAHKGLLHRGVRETISCYGVEMTPEHEVLTQRGWKQACEVVNDESCIGLDRKHVRLPDCVVSRRDLEREDKKSPMEMPLHLRQRSYARESVPSHKAQDDTAQLWVHARQHKTWGYFKCVIQVMGSHAQAMFEPTRQGLEKLWQKRHRYLPTMGLLRNLCSRYGPSTNRKNAWANRQLERIFSRELSLGVAIGAEQQHTCQYFFGHTERADDNITSCESIRAFADHTASKNTSVQMAPTKSTNNTNRQDVFDIANCGPRNRFVVMGDDGPLIVHNCGAAYADGREVVEFDAAPRLNVLQEVLEETDRKVIIFALFRSAIDTIDAHLIKHGYATAQIHGDVAANKRARIIDAFQKQPTPRVLIMQPQATAHGITLTAADTVVFYGPLMSVEMYMQCIARADRKGQDSDKVTVVHIQSSPLEAKMFKAMASKVTDHTLLTDMFDAEIKNS